MHRIGVQLREPGVQRVDVGVRQALGSQLEAPGPNVGRSHRRQLHRAKGDADPGYVRLGLSHRRRTVPAVALEPRRTPFVHGHPGGTGTDVRAGDKLRGLLVEPPLAVHAAGEVPGVFLTRVVSVAGAPLAVVALLDASHRSRPLLRRSLQAP